MKIVIKMPASHGDKVEVEGVVLSTRSSCEELVDVIMAAANIVWPIEPPEAPAKDTTKEKNGAGNNKK